MLGRHVAVHEGLGGGGVARVPCGSGWLPVATVRGGLVDGRGGGVEVRGLRLWGGGGGVLAVVVGGHGVLEAWCSGVHCGLKEILLTRGLEIN